MSRTMSAAIEYGSTTYVLLTILISVLAGVIPGFGNVINVFITVIILQILSTGFHVVARRSRQFILQGFLLGCAVDLDLCHQLLSARQSEP
jgi:ribose/xylose/arabinose/galactoside ABC-type transport system permease subunit